MEARMEAMVCRAGNTIPSLIASTSRLSSSKSSRSQCALLGDSRSREILRVVMLAQVNAKRNYERRSHIVFAKVDAQEQAEEDSATSDSATQPLLDITQSRSEFQPASIQSWVAVTFGAAVLVSTAFLPSVSLGPLEFLRQGLYVVGPSEVWKSILYGGAFVHVVEAAFAFFLARRIDPQNEAFWFWQTLYLGFFSLSLLLQKSKQKEALKQNL